MSAVGSEHYRTSVAFLQVLGHVGFYISLTSQSPQTPCMENACQPFLPFREQVKCRVPLSLVKKKKKSVLR